MLSLGADSLGRRSVPDSNGGNEEDGAGKSTVEADRVADGLVGTEEDSDVEKVR
jgi:hypothetical protein